MTGKEREQTWEPGDPVYREKPPGRPWREVRAEMTERGLIDEQRVAEHRAQAEAEMGRSESQVLVEQRLAESRRDRTPGDDHRHDKQQAFLFGMLAGIFFLALIMAVWS